MPGRPPSPVERYHDRIAGIYDGIYDRDPYWETVFQLTWRHIRRRLPRDLAARCLDVGCGTGRWGLRLVKAGYRVDFLDISRKMLDQVANKLAARGKAFRLGGGPAAPGEAAGAEERLWHASLDDLSGLAGESYDFIVGLGDPLGCAEKPGRAFKRLAGLLRPGGTILLSVDNRLRGIHHYFREGDLAGLEEFLRTGRTNWLTGAPGERYPLTMFTPGQLRAMCRERGLELLDLIGRTVLPLRRHRELLADPGNRARLLRLEEALEGEETLLANAPHLEFAARRGG
ncbi:MAG: methyltransferase domain-containing protein [Planctomycetota bacterium]|jgi:SAM-dependent methyltransferase|nr:methyltransferase domain-containing protein [Planctomycetota bacterium]